MRFESKICHFRTKELARRKSGHLFPPELRERKSSFDLCLNPTRHPVPFESLNIGANVERTLSTRGHLRPLDPAGVHSF